MFNWVKIWTFSRLIDKIYLAFKSCCIAKAFVLPGSLFAMHFTIILNIKEFRASFAYFLCLYNICKLSLQDLTFISLLIKSLLI